MTETHRGIEYPSPWRMVQVMDNASQQGRQFFYFADGDATVNAIRAYQRMNDERPFAEDIYGEWLLSGGWREWCSECGGREPDCVQCREEIADGV